MSAWLNKYFFVKEAKPRIVIGWFSLAIGVAVELVMLFYKKVDSDSFLNQYDLPTDPVSRFVAFMSATLILFVLICGIYNLFARHIGKK